MYFGTHSFIYINDAYHFKVESNDANQQHVRESEVAQVQFLQVSLTTVFFSKLLLSDTTENQQQVSKALNY